MHLSSFSPREGGHPRTPWGGIWHFILFLCQYPGDNLLGQMLLHYSVHFTCLTVQYELYKYVLISYETCVAKYHLPRVLWKCQIY